MGFIIKNNRKKAMSLLSLLIVLSMIVAIMAATVPIISQNIPRISKGKKKAGEISLTGSNGYFICYYDAGDKLSYKQIEFDRNNNVKITGEKVDASECVFKVPDADTYEVTLIGGGGGGASSAIKHVYDRNVESGKTITLGADNIFSANFFESLRQYISPYQTQAAINNLLNNVIVYVSGSYSGGSNTCARSYGNSDSVRLFLNSVEENIHLQFGFGKNQGDDYNGFCISNGDGAECDSSNYDFSYDGSLCGLNQDPSKCGCKNSNSSNVSDLNSPYGYGILFKISNKGRMVVRGEELNINLISYATETEYGEAGSPGEVIKYKTSYLTDGSDTIKIPKSAIGKGGKGASPSDIAGGDGGKTALTLNGVKMTANGGAGGTRQKTRISTLNDIKTDEKGQNGVKPDAYIPAQLKINETGLGVGLGSICTKDKCSAIDDSKYPGSSGASSGYHAGTDDFELGSLKLNTNDSVRVQVTDDDKNDIIIYPAGGKKNTYIPESESEFKPVLGNGGKGANGAIIISW